MPYEVQSKLREQKAMGGMPSNWRIEFVKMHDNHVHFINVDFTGDQHDRESVQAIADRILEALNNE